MATSLLGPDPSDSGQQSILGYEGTRTDELRDLKSTYTTESDGDRKSVLRESIAKVKADIRDRLSHFASSDNSLDWRIEFAEVIAEDGFDIAVANPPYIQLQRTADAWVRSTRTAATRPSLAPGTSTNCFMSEPANSCNATAG